MGHHRNSRNQEKGRKLHWKKKKETCGELVYLTQEMGIQYNNIQDNFKSSTIYNTKNQQLNIVQTHTKVRSNQ